MESRTVSLALQGGGALGAYTWGILDGLLEDGRLDVEGVSGASAGAINAATLGVGLSAGGRSHARELLRAIWEGLAKRAAARRRPRWDTVRWLFRNAGRLRTAAAFNELMTRMAADFAMEPETMEPLRGTLDATLDYLVLARPDAVRVFVNATNLHSAQPRVFTGEEVTTDAICASAAVPLLARPVTINGEHYWDGALLGNPLIYPVIYGCATSDIILIETQSAGRPGIPQTAAEVIARAVALSAAAGLVRERRMIDFVTQLLDDVPRQPHRKVRLHVMPVHPELALLEDAGTFHFDWPHLQRLYGLGRDSAAAWLGSRGLDDLGNARAASPQSKMGEAHEFSATG